jgi:hypothetical protein
MTAIGNSRVAFFVGSFVEPWLIERDGRYQQVGTKEGFQLLITVVTGEECDTEKIWFSQKGMITVGGVGFEIIKFDFPGVEIKINGTLYKINIKNETAKFLPVIPTCM